MSRLEQLQAELEQRRDGWWERLVEAIPELASLEETPQSSRFHAEGNVGVHTQMAVAACRPGSDPDLVWVALLHDIGKPDTTRRQPDGHVTAHGHDRAGAELAAAILERLGMPEQRRARIVWAVRHHMFHLSWQLTSAARLTRRQRRNLQHPDFPLLLEFLHIDALASQGRSNKLQTYTFYRDLWEQIEAESR